MLYSAALRGAKAARNALSGIGRGFSGFEGSERMIFPDRGSGTCAG